MDTLQKIVFDESFVVAEASGRLDLDATKKLFDQIGSCAAGEQDRPVLLDLRRVECDMDLLEIREIAVYAARPDPALPADRRVAVVVAGQHDFDHADLFALFADQRGMNIKAFDDMAEAEAWLEAE